MYSLLLDHGYYTVTMRELIHNVLSRRLWTTFVSGENCLLGWTASSPNESASRGGKREGTPPGAKTQEEN